MKDIEYYNLMQLQLDQDERDLTDHNSKVLEEVQKRQEGRDDNVNELEKYTIEQLEQYRREMEEGAKEGKSEQEESKEDP